MLEISKSETNGRGNWRVFAFAAVSMALFSGSRQMAWAADGDLDPTFGSGGKVITDVSGAEDDLHQIALQADGKIVAVGLADINTGGSQKIELVRYHTDGTLDSTFGNGGRVITVIAGANYATAKSVVIQSDGKIVIAGGVNLPNTVDTSFVLVRYHSDGTLDPTFGNGGIVITNVGDNRDSAEAVALQADGKIVAAGEKGIFRPPGEERNSDIALARYNPDGSLDPTFGNSGIVISDFGPVPGSFADDASAVLIQPDGKIVIAGDSDGGNYYDFLVARYNPGGTRDTTFGNNGFTKTDLADGSADGASDAILQPDGKILLVGAAESASFDLDFAMARYNASGTLDQTFGNGGKVTMGLESLRDEELTSVVLQLDGKFVVLGDSNSSTNSGFLLLRFDTNGSLDTTFGTGGIVRTSFAGNNIQSEDLVSQPDGKLLAGGFNFYQNSDFALARYLDGSNPTPTPTPTATPGGTPIPTPPPGKKAKNGRRGIPTANSTLELQAPPDAAKPASGKS